MLNTFLLSECPFLPVSQHTTALKILAPGKLSASSAIPAQLCLAVSPAVSCLKNFILFYLFIYLFIYIYVCMHIVCMFVS